MIRGLLATCEVHNRSYKTCLMEGDPGCHVCRRKLAYHWISCGCGCGLDARVCRRHKNGIWSRFWKAPGRRVVCPDRPEGIPGEVRYLRDPDPWQENAIRILEGDY